MDGHCYKKICLQFNFNFIITDPVIGFFYCVKKKKKNEIIWFFMDNNILKSEKIK